MQDCQIVQGGLCDHRSCEVLQEFKAADPVAARREAERVAIEEAAAGLRRQREGASSSFGDVPISSLPPSSHPAPAPGAEMRAAAARLGVQLDPGTPPAPPAHGPFRDWIPGVPGGEVRITDEKTGGQKGQKPERFDLIPFDALEEVARVYGWGAQKYEDDNYLKGYRWRLSAGALCRHVARWMLGEDRDRESGLHHIAHAGWHCLTLLTFALRGLGTDDRAKAVRS